MPARTKRACRKPGCPGTTTHRSGYCIAHQKTDAGWNRRNDRKGSTTERGYGYAWQKLRLQALRRDRYLCQECLRNGIVREGQHVDHIVRKALGGTDALTNLQTLCTTCHNHKTATERHG